MNWTSIIAIYALFWVMTAFVVLPIGVRTHDELGSGKDRRAGGQRARKFQAQSRFCCERHCCRRRCLAYIMPIMPMAGSIATVSIF